MADVYLLTSTNPYENLATEEYVTLTSTEPALILWQNEATVVIGNHQNAWVECDYERLKADGGRLARRITGGGAVYHDLGNLNFSFICSEEEFSPEKNFEIVKRALSSLGIEAEVSGRNDLEVGGKKVSGSAFLHRNGRVLHHGTLLVSSDLTKLASYLSVSKKKLLSKGIKSVSSRVCNLSDGSEVTVSALKDAIEREYVTRFGAKRSLVPERTSYAELADKYASYDFIFGENPRFSLECEERFKWGTVSVGLNFEANAVSSCKIFTDSLSGGFVAEVERLLVGARYQKEKIEALKASVIFPESEDVLSLVAREID